MLRALTPNYLRVTLCWIVVSYYQECPINIPIICSLVSPAWCWWFSPFHRIWHYFIPLSSSLTTLQPHFIFLPLTNTSTQFWLRAFALAVHHVWNALAGIFSMSPNIQVQSSAVISSETPFLTALLKMASIPQEHSTPSPFFASIPLWNDIVYWFTY